MTSPPSSLVAAQPVATPRTILIVDDSVEITHLLGVWLESENHRVFRALSGREARKILAREAIDVLVTDILMPDGDGIELLNALRSRAPRPRLIAMSGGGHYLAAPNCLELARAAGADACLQKPFTSAELLASLAGRAA
jgi:CheY-like chemotaxis protein